jgi:hypothetical protein
LALSRLYVSRLALARSALARVCISNIAVSRVALSRVSLAVPRPYTPLPRVGHLVACEKATAPTASVWPTQTPTQRARAPSAVRHSRDVPSFDAVAISCADAPATHASTHADTLTHAHARAHARTNTPARPHARTRPLQRHTGSHAIRLRRRACGRDGAPIWFSGRRRPSGADVAEDGRPHEHRVAHTRAHTRTHTEAHRHAPRARTQLAHEAHKDTRACAWDTRAYTRTQTNLGRSAAASMHRWP